MDFGINALVVLARNLPPEDRNETKMDLSELRSRMTVNADNDRLALLAEAKDLLNHTHGLHSDLIVSSDARGEIVIPHSIYLDFRPSQREFFYASGALNLPQEGMDSLITQTYESSDIRSVCTAKEVSEAWLNGSPSVVISKVGILRTREINIEYFVRTHSADSTNVVTSCALTSYDSFGDPNSIQNVGFAIDSLRLLHDVGTSMPCCVYDMGSDISVESDRFLKRSRGSSTFAALTRKFKDQYLYHYLKMTGRKNMDCPKMMLVYLSMVAGEQNRPTPFGKLFNQWKISVAHGQDDRTAIQDIWSEPDPQIGRRRFIGSVPMCLQLAAWNMLTTMSENSEESPLMVKMQHHTVQDVLAGNPFLHPSPFSLGLRKKLSCLNDAVTIIYSFLHKPIVERVPRSENMSDGIDLHFEDKNGNLCENINSFYTVISNYFSNHIWRHIIKDDLPFTDYFCISSGFEAMLLNNHHNPLNAWKFLVMLLNGNLTPCHNSNDLRSTIIYGQKHSFWKGWVSGLFEHPDTPSCGLNGHRDRFCDPPDSGKKLKVSETGRRKSYHGSPTVYCTADDLTSVEKINALSRKLDSGDVFLSESDESHTSLSISSAPHEIQHSYVYCDAEDDQSKRFDAFDLQVIRTPWIMTEVLRIMIDLPSADCPPPTVS
jgi:hypothetical protein